MAKLGKNAMRIGKHVVKISPYTTAALLAYDVGSYMYNNNAYVKDLVDRNVKNVKEFIDETLEDVGLHISKDGEVLEKSKASNNNKNNAKINSTPDTKGTPDPDWEPDDEGEKNEFKWEVKTLQEAKEIYGHKKFKKIMRDPIQKWGKRDLWFSKDTAGHSGASQGKSPSAYKLFVEENKIFKHVADVDKFGRIIPKNKGEIGSRIKIKDCWKIK